MTTRQRCMDSYDELIAGHYGRPRAEATAEQVIAGYYGAAARRKQRPPAHALTLSRDDGELLPQKAVPPKAEGDQPVVYEQGESEEYVVAARAEPVTGSPVDEILRSVAEPVAPAPAEPPPPAAAEPAPPAVPEPPTAPPAQAAEAGAAPAQAASVSEDDELKADMEAILSGAKVFDPASGETVERDSVGGAAAARRPATPPPSPPPVREQEAIFDRIAESMRYANAYDLGTVELENRFSDFDRMSDVEERGREAKRRRRAEPSAPAPPEVGAAEFLDDLETLRESAEPDGADEARAAAADAIPQAQTASIDHGSGYMDCGPSALSVGLRGDAPEIAKAMYDAGEHALGGDGLYPDALHVGRSPGVAFSYGELLAMGDLYESVDQMMDAPTAELTELKELVDRSTRFYEVEKSARQSHLDVSHEKWDSTTGGRYLKLAEENYEHFAPNTLFNDEAMLAATTHGNYKAAWEAHHKRAIEEAQKLALQPENQNRSYVPEWPLIINAFGDHFLTDAFASGHLINKDVMNAKFRARFFSGGKLTPAAEKFFERVAKAAFVGEVARKFSVLETFEPRLFWWNPNIDNPNVFRKLLREAAMQEPEKVANVLTKALHDHLNEVGIKVTNGAGDKPWDLTGDQYLNADSLGIMRKAVKQSTENITNPAILQSNLDVGPYFARVWRYVPQLTPKSRAVVVGLVDEYSSPASTVLSAAVAKIIHDQVDSLIKVLIKEKKLKPA